MAISCIRSQAVNLCANRSINWDRESDYYRTLAQQADTVSFQVRLTPYNGDNRVSNGDFATSSDWAFGTGWAYDAVDLEADATASSGTLAGTAAISQNYYYRLKWTIKNYVSGQLSVECPLGVVRLGAAFPATGDSFDFTYHFEQALVGADIEFNASAFTGSVDDVEVVVMSTIGLRIVDEDGNIVWSDYTNSNGYITYLQEGNTSPELLDPYPEIPRANVEFVWDDLGLSAGCYRVEVVDTAEVLEVGTATGSLVSVLQSQYFNVATTHTNTLQLSWTNSDKLAVGGGDVINYSDLSFTQYLRLRGELGSPVVENENETYHYNDGTRLTAFNRAIVTRTLKVDNIPEHEHIAIAIGLKHDTFKIDGNRAFNAADGYEPRYRRTSNLAPVDVDIYLQTDQYENRSCDTAEDPQYATVNDQGKVTEVSAGDTYICSAIKGTAQLMKSGQTVSYRTGDDGDIEPGRLTDFTTLESVNPFGNTNRFTDRSGGQTYSDDIVIDWSTFNGTNVNGYYKGSATTLRTWDAAIDWAVGLSVSGFGSWYLINFAQAASLYSCGSNPALNYAPFSLNIANYWTSTTLTVVTTQAFVIRLYDIELLGKTASCNTLAYRLFTVNGTTLS